MELLAPAGNIENFFAALEAGADAVYVGAPGFNARNLAKDLQLEEIGAMIRYCHAREKKLYVAANSLLLERELPQVIETLALLETLGPDALIVQDLGLIQLVQKHFPRLKMHASTLMTAHNSLAVQTLSRLGCERVVLARELTLKEIGSICARTDVEIEIFIHGAMCFSYSGLCLFSSFLGGKSGLRGRCVQPCRRAYTTSGKGKKGGREKSGAYLFSMNDLTGLAAIPALKEAGVTSLKIEGRLRSAHYVRTVVQAYRLAMDAKPEEFQNVLPQAEVLVEKAMSRKITSGYFFSPQPPEAITPYHSGNIGLHLGRAQSVMPAGAVFACIVSLKENLQVGDRLRLHMEPSGERLAFTLKELRLGNEPVERAVSANLVRIVLPATYHHAKGDSLDLYKIDSGKTGKVEIGDLQIGAVKKDLGKSRLRLAKRILSITWDAWESGIRKDIQEQVGQKRPQVNTGGSRQKKAGTSAKMPLDWWLRTDSLKTLQGKLPFSPDRFVLAFEKGLTGQAGQIKRLLGGRIRDVIWALPPVIMEQDLAKNHKQISLLIRSGFKCFQLGHISQTELFVGQRVHLSADYSLNLLNNQAVVMAGQTGFESVQLSIEADREALRELIQGYKKTGVQAAGKEAVRRSTQVGLTVYGSPALYTARLAAAHFSYDRPIVSPKGEPFVIRRKEGYTQTHPLRPFSLLPYLVELKNMGLDYVVVDISGEPMGGRSVQELHERLIGSGRYAKLSTFNYLGKLE
ncbi:MAG: peptidase U32 family protein [Desulfoprunum sp.]|nr:peptidase U32 family protein [Desulfoprunum sp.]